MRLLREIPHGNDIHSILKFTKLQLSRFFWRFFLLNVTRVCVATHRSFLISHVAWKNNTRDWNDRFRKRLRVWLRRFATLSITVSFKFHVFSFSFFEQIFFQINSILREPLWEMVIVGLGTISLRSHVTGKRDYTRSCNQETWLMLEFAKPRRHSRKLERARTFTHDPVVVG